MKAHAEKAIYETDTGIDDWSALWPLIMPKDIELFTATLNGV
jgi:inosine-uridine nucleoside N-ribohydrolase